MLRILATKAVLNSYNRLLIGTHGWCRSISLSRSPGAIQAGVKLDFPLHGHIVSSLSGKDFDEWIKANAQNKGRAGSDPWLREVGVPFNVLPFQRWRRLFVSAQKKEAPTGELVRRVLLVTVRFCVEAYQLVPVNVEYLCTGCWTALCLSVCLNSDGCLHSAIIPVYLPWFWYCFWDGDDLL